MSAFDQLPVTMQRKATAHPISECWTWRGARNSRGYGCVTNGRGGTMLVHRKAYELLVGPIPEGLTIDHLCRNKLCVNPAHMEPVTREENSSRGTRHVPSFCYVEREPVAQRSDFMDIFEKYFGHLTEPAS